MDQPQVSLALVNGFISNDLSPIHDNNGTGGDDIFASKDLIIGISIGGIVIIILIILGVIICKKKSKSMDNDKYKELIRDDNL